MLPDDKILVGYYRNMGNSDLYRLNADGSRDTSFPLISLSGQIYVIRLLAGGQFLVGGNFQPFRPPVIRGIARFNFDGTFDNSFNTGLDILSNSQTVYDIEVASNGKIMIGGSVNQFNSALTRRKAARLNSDGTFDDSLNFSGAGDVYNVAVLPEDKILLAGGDLRAS